TRDLVSVERAVISAPGVVRSIQIPDHQGDHPILYPEERVFVTCSEGDTVSVPTNNVQKVANIIAVGRSSAEAEDRVVQIRRHITIGLEPHNPNTDHFIFEEGWRGPWAHYELPEELVNELERRPMIQGDRTRLQGLIREGHPVPVSPLSNYGSLANRGLTARHIAVDGLESLERLVETGVIAWTMESPRADGLFWKAFLSAGVQGITYMVSGLAASQEVTV
ncbi:MAG TPA: hypothetical protein VJ932_08595, partial [Alkalispirochaeta sp.]|nr:hypothetical protein [Alkalispirochaeta sp.]